MGFFGFVENFFFISLALVFALILLLVYHFKNRITVAEKKSESMYGLLTAVVKEIKSLRGMFGLGGASEPENSIKDKDKDDKEDISVEIKTKSTPEVNVAVESSENVHNSTTFNSFVKSKPTEVISLDFCAYDEKKIVVSDDDSDDESDDDDDEESDSCDSSVSSDEFDQIDELDISEVIQVEYAEKPEQVDDIHVVQEFTDYERDSKLEIFRRDSAGISNENEVQQPIMDMDMNSVATTCVPIEEEVIQVFSREENESTEEKKETLPSVDQLKKMSINQLKTVASQVGVTTDISKMKKPELISAIQAVL